METGAVLVDGKAKGELLHSDVPISFWGGIDAATGEVIDRTHPLFGKNVKGRILAIPSGRGSCTGSSVIMELILNGHGPAGMIFAQKEEILSLGVIVAEEVFGVSIPMVALGAEGFAALESKSSIGIDGNRVFDAGDMAETHVAGAAPRSALRLSDPDRRMLAGGEGRAAALAMRIILRFANILGASALIDVTRAHIDGCIYTGAASLNFARALCDGGARVRVPTTLNAISVDRLNWRQQGTDPDLGEPASALADAYVAMGAEPTFTCAPYQLASAPVEGENIVWAESNAVVYANSVLGARTMKYPDYLDICIALTGRAPLAGCHLDSERRARLHVAVTVPEGIDDAFYPLLGYHAGLLSPSEIPVLSGLEAAHPTPDDLKAFGAAFATSSGAPMFHIVGVTPEACDLAQATGGMDVERVAVGPADLAGSWTKLNSATELRVDLVSLGNPHFSADEFARLSALCKGRIRDPDVAVVVTAGRATVEAITRAGIREELEAFGVQIVVDTCWCMVVEPVIPPHARTIITNSGKYAHYGTGLSGRKLYFASLAGCVEAACTGRASAALPAWLTP
nr:aconitase X [uncultured Gellertiella sp.]